MRVVSVGDERGEVTLTTLAELVGVIAGLASLLYVAGAGVMTLRLVFSDMPHPIGAAARLSREVLISTGLALLGPVLLVGACYLGWRAVRDDAPIRRVAGWAGSSWVERYLLLFLAVMGGLVILSPGIYWALFGNGLDWLADEAAGANFLFAAWFVASVVVFVALNVRDRLLTHEFDTKARFNMPKAKLVFATLWGLTILPGCILAATSIKFPETLVCIAGVDEGIEGILVGESETTVFVGSNVEGDPTRQLLAVGTDRVEGVFVGETDWDEIKTCQVVSPSD